jgi:hypothetical protein
MLQPTNSFSKLEKFTQPAKPYETQGGSNWAPPHQTCTSGLLIPILFLHIKRSIYEKLKSSRGSLQMYISGKGKENCAPLSFEVRQHLTEAGRTLYNT